jgi:hypothetical protein
MAASTTLHSLWRSAPEIAGASGPRGSLSSSLIDAALLTPLVLLVHGFHPYAGDAGIYVAGVRHILDPSLYERNAAFVDAFTKFSLFPWLAAAVVRVSHLSLAWTLFAAQLLSIFLFLTACGGLASRFFASQSARWCSVLLAVACFTLPVAGTALVLMDPYVTARSFSTPLSLMAVAACIDRAWSRMVLLLILAALIHPLMGVHTSAFVILHACVRSGRTRLAVGLCSTATVACGVAFAAAHWTPISPAYRQAVALAPRTFLFLARWHWYEVLGLVLPLVLYGAAFRIFGSASRKGPVCLTCLLLGTTSVVIAASFVPPEGPYLLVPLQVLRSFHLIYAVAVVLSGGILAAVFARSRTGAFALLAVLFASMFAAQRASWSGSIHIPWSGQIEWPGSEPANSYQQAFLWIRDNTPRNAVFAFNPQLVYLPEEDEQGFRAISLRDHLADDKDAGVAAVVPQLAERWAIQRNAEFSVDRMTDAERRTALVPLGANWLLLPPNATTGLPCSYINRVAKVCRLDP